MRSVWWCQVLADGVRQKVSVDVEPTPVDVQLLPSTVGDSVVLAVPDLTTTTIRQTPAPPRRTSSLADSSDRSTRGPVNRAQLIPVGPRPSPILQTAPPGVPSTVPSSSSSDLVPRRFLRPLHPGFRQPCPAPPRWTSSLADASDRSTRRPVNCILLSPDDTDPMDNVSQPTISLSLDSSDDDDDGDDVPPTSSSSAESISHILSSTQLSVDPRSYYIYNGPVNSGTQRLLTIIVLVFDIIVFLKRS